MTQIINLITGTLKKVASLTPISPFKTASQSSRRGWKSGILRGSLQLPDLLRGPAYRLRAWGLGFSQALPCISLVRQVRVLG